MRRITLETIAELPEREQRQLKACMNHHLGKLYAASKRRKKIITERTKIELEVIDDEDN